MIKKKKFNKNTNWGVVIFDIGVMILATVVSVWQNNPNYLWLLILMFASGSLITYQTERGEDGKT